MESFHFMTSVESVQLTGRRASNLMELFLNLQEVEGSCLYHHTHRFYRAHSFLGPWDRSDFALWVGQTLKEAAVAEQMGGLDPRDFTTMEDLRGSLLGALAPMLEEKERCLRKVPPGLEFHFCKSVSLVMPTGREARNLEDLIHALERVDTASLYYHMIEAPLHFHGKRDFPNDLSQWLHESGFTKEARALTAIDPYRSDLEALREDLLSALRGKRLRDRLRKAAGRLTPVPSGEAAALWLKRWRGEA